MRTICEQASQPQASNGDRRLFVCAAESPSLLLYRTMNPTASLPTPSLKRRIAVMVYESLILFAIVFTFGIAFGVVFQQTHALYLRHALQAWIFLVVGVYFVWFWSRGRQTLPMKTWHVQLVTNDGRPVSMLRAAVRYVLCWLWFVPGLALAAALQAEGWMMVIIVSISAVIWAMAAYFDPQRQFLHDRMAGTRLVQTKVSARKKAAA